MRANQEATVSTKIFVGNLSFNTSSEQLREILPSPENVVSVALIADRETQRSRGFAFVEYSTTESAESAIRALNEIELDGRQLRVNAAEDRPRSSGGGPRSGGGFSPRSEGFSPPPTFSRPKGSRRGLRGRKRSLGG
ncbi:MAG: RNA recognition motif domain-containing protein [Candidatus Binatia bacterium]